MTNTSCWFPVLSLLAVAACGRSSADSKSGAETAPSGATIGEASAPSVAPPAAVPCTAGAIDELVRSALIMSKVVYDEHGGYEAVKAKRQSMVGTSVAFSGCTFESQGNDQVTFSAEGSEETLECHMKGGEAGLRAFLQTAMTIERAKLRLDVRGTFGWVGAGTPYESLALTSCEIVARSL